MSHLTHPIPSPRLSRSLIAGTASPIACGTYGCCDVPAPGEFWCPQCLALAARYDVLERLAAKPAALSIIGKSTPRSLFDAQPGRLDGGVEGEDPDEEDDEPIAARVRVVEAAVVCLGTAAVLVCVPVGWLTAVAIGMAMGWFLARLPVMRAGRSSCGQGAVAAQQGAR